MSKISCGLSSFILIACTVFAFSTSAQAATGYPDLLARFFPQWFGSEEPQPRQEGDVLVAPFADSARTETEPRKLSLDQPNMTDYVVREWLTKAVSEIFHVDMDDYDKHIELLATGMLPSAVAQFDTFLEDSNLKVTLKNRDLILNCFVESPPFIRNKAALEERFRWLFDVHLTLNMIPRDFISYDRSKIQNENEPIHVMARIQVGRVPEGGIDGVMIESITLWSREKEERERGNK